MSDLKINALIAVADELVASKIHAVLKRRSLETIVLVKSTHEAIDAMHKTLFNLFIVDAAIPVSLTRKTHIYGGIDFIKFIRMCAGTVSESTIVFLRSSSCRPAPRLWNRSLETAEALDAGSSCILKLPFTEEAYNSIVQPLIRQPPCFVRTHQYTGPCRRNVHLSEKVDKCR